MPRELPPLLLQTDQRASCSAHERQCQIHIDAMLPGDFENFMLESWPATSVIGSLLSEEKEEEDKKEDHDIFQ
jgi:hypothetical protein